MIEVVVSILLIAIAAAGVFGALFSASLQASVSTDQELASLQVQSLLDELRNFVTEDTSDGPDAPGAASGGTRSWRLPGDLCGCWALQTGVEHDVTARLPAPLAGRATMNYRVEVLLFDGREVRQVRARLDWTPSS